MPLLLGRCDAPPSVAATFGPFCPRTTFAAKLAEGSVVTYAIGDKEHRATTISRDAPEEGACQVRIRGGQADKRGRAPELTLSLHCNVGPAGEDATVSYRAIDAQVALGDPRSLSSGHEDRAFSDNISVAYDVSATDRCCTTCRPPFERSRYAIEVNEAEGESAPFPKLVTDDYRRVFRVEIVAERSQDDAGAPSEGRREPPEAGEDGRGTLGILRPDDRRFGGQSRSSEWALTDGSSCAQGFRLEAQLHLEQTKSDFVEDPHVPCE